MPQATDPIIDKTRSAIITIEKNSTPKDLLKKIQPALIVNDDSTPVPIRPVASVPLMRPSRVVKPDNKGGFVLEKQIWIRKNWFAADNAVTLYTVPDNSVFYLLGCVLGQSSGAAVNLYLQGATVNTMVRCPDDQSVVVSGGGSPIGIFLAAEDISVSGGGVGGNTGCLWGIVETWEGDIDFA